MAETNQRMQRVLKTPALVAFGLAYMVPLTIFTTYGQVTVMSEGHLPIAYILTLVAMLFTAYSYCKMTVAVPLAGSAYSYVQKTFGGSAGFLVGWAQILDYLFLPMINHLVIGLYLNEAYPDIPVAAIILTSIALVTVLNIIGIRLITSVNFTLIAAQLVFIAVFLFLALSPVEFTTANMLKPLMFDNSHVSGLLGGAAVLCLAFLGFDAIATMTEEAHDAAKTVPRAIVLTVIVAGILFLTIAYVAHLAYPDWKSLEANQDTASMIVIQSVGGKWLGKFFLATYLTGAFASAMSSQASVSRILYAMGREGVMPKVIFFNINKRFQTPHLSIIFVSLISLTALFISLEFVVSMISFGALGAFTFVNLCVIKHFIINQKRKGFSALVQYGLIPFVGVLLCIWLWTSLSFPAIRIGLIWVVIGFLYLMYLTTMFKHPPPQLSADEYDDLVA